MLNILLTSMLFILPFLIIHPQLKQNGFNLGLWISLFFWGRFNQNLSILIFSCALFYYIFTYLPNKKEPDPVPFPKKPKLPFIIFSSSLVAFCALGDVFPAYGKYLYLNDILLNQAGILGFFCSLAGPLLFGLLCDNKGPYPAMITLILTAASSIGLTAYSSISPNLFLIGSSMLWLSISGCFVLIPIFMEIYFGQVQMKTFAPMFIFAMTAIWGFVYVLYETNADKIGNSTTFLTFSIYLTLIAALTSFLSWKKRLTLVQ